MDLCYEISSICGGVAAMCSDVCSSTVDYVCENPGKVAAVVGGTVVTGGLSALAAPSIVTAAGSIGLLGSASTGTAISTLSGAALQSASLAAVGGGALAAGGGGVAAGTAIATAVGATAGATAGGVASVAIVTKSEDA